MVKNIIPLPAFIYVATNAVISLYMANGVTGEDAAEALNAEIACASAIAKLAGFDVNRAAGVFTFGGTGTNLYAHKIGLAKLLQQIGLKGYRSSKIVTVGSRSSHYSHQTVSDWLGIGQRNYIQVASNIDQTTNLQELEKACRSAIKAGKKIACIEAVGGTTSNMAIDDVKKIYAIRKKLIADIIAEQSQYTQQEIEKMFLEADTRTPEQAKEKGLINDIREVNIPEGAEVVQFIFQRK